MLVSLALLAWLVLVFPQVLAQAAGPIMRLVRQLLLGEWVDRIRFPRHAGRFAD